MAAQEAKIRSACEHHGWVLLDIVRDEAESGKSLDRPGLTTALKRIAAGEASGLVAAKLDRLTRSVLHFATLLAWFDQAQATLVALDLSIDTSTPGGRLVANVFASVAEWERETIAARTRDGLQALRAQGKPTGRPAVIDRPEITVRISTMRTQRAGRGGLPTPTRASEDRPAPRHFCPSPAKATGIVIGTPHP
jgi:DNA invertase Pin-like site-specific DNA recombinase